MKYVDEFDNSMINRWDMHDVPVHMRVWLAELEWTFDTMRLKQWLPSERETPNAGFIEALAEEPAAKMYYGNRDYDVMVHLMRLWRAVDVTHYITLIQNAGEIDGDTGDVSAEVSINLRGSIVESMLRRCQQMAVAPRHLRPCDLGRCVDWYLHWKQW